MAELRFKIPEETEGDLKKMIKSVAREAIEELRESEFKLKDYMNKTEVQKAMNISSITLNNWINKGLKVSVIEGKNIISKQNLMKFIQDHEM